MDGLEKRIKDLIECLYNCIYEGDLEVKKDKDYYMLTLYLWNQPHCEGGTTYGNQCKCDDEFIKYIEKKLKESRLDLSSRGQLRLLNY